MTVYADVLLSLIHSTEMQAINILVKEETIKKPCKDFIDAKADYIRKSTKAYNEILSNSMDYLHKAFSKSNS